MENDKETNLYKDKIYVGKGRPPNNLQPKLKGVMWIDYSVPTLYICTNNNTDAITWLHIDEKEILEIRKLITALEGKLKSYNNRLNSIIR